MQLTATLPARSARRVPVIASVAIACAIVVALTLPLALARPANLTSDESLYLAEAYSVAHGDGLTYPSGEPVAHRAPLFPLTLAPAVAAAGPDAAYTVAKMIVIINVLLVTFIAWRMAGTLAGAAAGVTAGGSAFLNGLGTTLYLDPLQTTFVLLAIASLTEAIRSPRIAWFAAAGAAIGLSFLVKEAAVQFVPLGVVAWLALPSLRSHAGARGALAFSVAFAAVVAPWFVWIWLKTSSLFLLGDVSVARQGAIVVAAMAFAAFAAAIARWPLVPPERARAIAPFAVPAAVTLVACWGGAVLYTLEAHDGWDYPVSYWTSVPRYLRTVAPSAQPYLLLLASLGWLGVRACKRDDDARLLIIVAVMFAPFALFAANRGLQLRDALPIIYIAHIALGLVAADVARYARRSLASPTQEMALAVVIALAAGVFVVHQMRVFSSDNADAAAVGVRFDSWDSDFVQEIAASMDEHIPPGATVVTSRLYFSSLHVETGGQYRIRQMPTVAVNLDTGRDELIARRSNLFRWEDPELRPARPGDTWLWLKRFEGKNYWVGLGQQELLEYVDAHDAAYVLLTGEDVAFSSLHAAPYLSGHPAFELIDAQHVSTADQYLLYRVDRTQLALRPHPTAISPEDAGALADETGWTLDRIARALGTPIRITDINEGLSARERQDALAGSGITAATSD